LILKDCGVFDLRYCRNLNHTENLLNGIPASGRRTVLTPPVHAIFEPTIAELLITPVQVIVAKLSTAAWANIEVCWGSGHCVPAYGTYVPAQNLTANLCHIVFCSSV